MLNFVVDGNLAFSVIQQPSFGQLINTVAGRDVNIPKNGIFMKFMKEQFNLMKAKLVELLNKQDYVCVTCDVWSSRAQAYLGMSIHFINDDYQRESYVLAFRELKYKQTHVVMATEILKVFNEYGIAVEKITNIVTDGGSAFCKAFKVYGKGSDPLIESVANSNDNVNVDDNDDGDNDANPFMQYDDGEFFYSNIIQFDDNETTGLAQLDDDLLDDATNFLNDMNDGNFLDDFLDDVITHDTNAATECVMAQLPPHRRCLSHLLNLIAGEFDLKLSVRASTALISTLNKLQAIWVSPRRSSESKSLCQDYLGCKLKIPVETRWNSKFNAIQQIHSIGIEKMEMYISALKASIKSASNLSLLTNEDFKVMLAYIKVMKPVANSLDRLQGEQNCGQGYILPTLKTMKQTVEQLTEGPSIASPLLKSFQETMLKVIDSRFRKHLKLDETNKDLVLAAFSTPRLKTKFITDSFDWDLVRNMLILECKNLSSQSIEEPYDEPANNDSDDEFLISYPRSNRRNSIEQIVEAEVDRYLNDDRKYIKVLDEYPLVRKVYFKYNTTLCSSGAIERVFSQSALIFTPRRNRISAGNFEACLLLKYNRKLI